MNTKVMPPTYFMIFLVLAIASHFLFPGIRFHYYPWNLLGLLLIVFGAILNLWTDALFKRSETTVKPHELPTAFQADGPFKISRHPMYLGMTAILLGTAVFMMSLLPYFAAVIFVFLMEILFIPTEERNLARQFGETYRHYCNNVRRWI